MTTDPIERKLQDKLQNKLQDRLLTARRVEGDCLMLADAVLNAALDGSRPLSAGEREALQTSPLTLRRLRSLALARRAATAASAADARWCGSAGMLRAASSSGAPAPIATDDGAWQLHFIEGENGDAGNAWRIVLVLAAGAPFAARLMRDRPQLRVVDGAGSVILQGQLDADGECEGVWPFATTPVPHFHASGAGFKVEPVHN